MNYDYSECRNIANSKTTTSDKLDAKLEARKNQEDAVKYFHERVFFTDSGKVYAYKDNCLKLFTLAEFKESQMIGFDAQLKKKIFESCIPYTDILSSTAPQVDHKKRTINTMQPIHAKSLNVKVGEKGLKYVEYFKKFLFEIICDKNKAKYDIITKLCAKIAQGQKSTVIIVMVSSSEGVGKTSLAKIMGAILGTKLITFPTPESMIRFNYQCYGKLLVVVEETEGLQRGEGALNDKLKNMATNDMFSYEMKGIQSTDLPNVNNVMITSNFTISCCGRRYFNLTPSSAWLHDEEKWDKLYDFADENIKAVYNYLSSIDITNFKEQSEVYKLNKESGNQREIEKMNDVWRFIKHNYALTKTSKSIKRKDLYDEYCLSSTKPYKKSTFSEKMAELDGVTFREQQKLNGNKTDFYIIDGEKLLAGFRKRNLISTEDEVEEQQEENEPLAKELNQCKQEFTKIQIQVLKEENERKDEENKKLKQEIEELKQQLQKLQAKTKETKTISVKAHKA